MFYINKPIMKISMTLAVLFGMSAGVVSATPLVSWDFPDQGANANCSVAATAIAPEAIGGSMVFGSAFLAQQIVDVNGAVINTYLNDPVTTLSGNVAIPCYWVGDATVNISRFTPASDLSLITDGILGIGIAAASVPDVTTAVTQNLYLDFPVTASGADLTVTNFNFLAQSSNHSSRKLDHWAVQVSIDGGAFSTLHTGTSWSHGQSVWSKESSAALSQVILDGQTATFRLIPLSSKTTSLTRGHGIDAVTIEGTGASGPAQEPPVLTPEPYTGAAAVFGIYYELDISGAVTDLNGDAITNYAKFTGDSWINVETNGLIYGTPDVGGVTSTVEVVITDATGLSSTNTVNIPVLASVLEWGVTNIGKGVVAVGEVFSDTVADRIDTSAGGITFANLSGGWLVVDENTGALSGTPTIGDWGENTFIIRADDGVLQKDATVTIDVIFGSMVWGENFENTVILSGGNWPPKTDIGFFDYTNEVETAAMASNNIQTDVWFSRTIQSNTVVKAAPTGVSEHIEWRRTNFKVGVILHEADLDGAGTYTFSAAGVYAGNIAGDSTDQSLGLNVWNVDAAEYVLDVEGTDLSVTNSAVATNLVNLTGDGLGNVSATFTYDGTGDLVLGLENDGVGNEFLGADSIRLHKGGDQTPSGPNIIVFFSDDHTQQAISAYQNMPNANPRDALFKGFALMDSPNLDRLANNGVIFRNSLCSNPLCQPSRATLLTGLYSHMNGVVANNYGPNGLPPTQQTFPLLLQAAGYDTAMFGKWHLDEYEPYGFDHYERLLNQGDYFDPLLRSVPLPGVTNDVTWTNWYISDLLVDRATNWLDARVVSGDGAPFFMMINNKGTHTPFAPHPSELDPDTYRAGEWDYGVTPNPDTAPGQPWTWTPSAAPLPSNFDDYTNGFPTRAQGASLRTKGTMTANGVDNKTGMKSVDISHEGVAYDEVRQWWATNKVGLTAYEKDFYIQQHYVKDYGRSQKGIDKCVGEILDYLAAHGLDRNTIVIYSADQGFFLGEHGWTEKRWCYEEPLRTPMLMQYLDANGNSLLPSGTVVDKLVQVLDIGPTVLDAAGIVPPVPMQGKSFLGLVTSDPGDDPAEWRDASYFHYHNGYDGNHKVVKHYGLRTERYKLIYEYEIGQWELFDLQSDPLEMTNLFYSTLGTTPFEPENGVAAPVSFQELVTGLMVKLKYLREQYGDTTGVDFTVPGQLAPISFVAADFTNASQVSTAGTLIEAVNCNGASDVAVNGVTFAATPDADKTGVHLENGYEKGASNADYFKSARPNRAITGLAPADGDALFDTLFWSKLDDRIILTGLESGAGYELQLLLVNDSVSDSTVTVSALGGDTTNGTGVLDHSYSSDMDGSAVQLVTCTFTADGTVQPFDISQSGNDAWVNAWQLRQVASTPPLSQWKQGLFTAAELADESISGNAADIDQDNMPLLFEYLLNLDPNSPEAVPSGLFEEVAGTLQWVVEFQRDASRNDADLILEWCTTLTPGSGETGWLPVMRITAGGAVEVLNGAALISEIGSAPATVRISAPSEGPAGFLRWKAFHAPPQTNPQ